MCQSLLEVAQNFVLCSAIFSGTCHSPLKIGRSSEISSMCQCLLCVRCHVMLLLPLCQFAVVLWWISHSGHNVISLQEHTWVLGVEMVVHLEFDQTSQTQLHSRYSDQSASLHSEQTTRLHKCQNIKMKPCTTQYTNAQCIHNITDLTYRLPTVSQQVRNCKLHLNNSEWHCIRYKRCVWRKKHFSSKMF